jgi:hypothetical protein
MEGLSDKPRIRHDDKQKYLIEHAPPHNSWDLYLPPDPEKNTLSTLSTDLDPLGEYMLTFICHSREFQQGHWTLVVIFPPVNLIQPGAACMVAHIDSSCGDRDHHVENLVTWQSALVVKHLTHHAHHLDTSSTLQRSTINVPSPTWTNPASASLQR